MLLAARQLDRRFAELEAALLAMERPPRGWIKAIREALGMTTAQLAARMGVAQPRIAQLEKQEAERAVNLQSLERAAEALDCRLVYFLVPTGSLEDRILTQADRVAAQQLASVDQTMRLEKQGVSDSKQQDALKAKITTYLLERPSRLWQGK